MADITTSTQDIGQTYSLLADFSSNKTHANNLQLMIQAHESVELAYSADAESPFYTLPAGFNEVTLEKFYPRGQLFARISGNETHPVTVNVW